MPLVWGNHHHHFLKSNEPGKAALESAFSDKARWGQKPRFSIYYQFVPGQIFKHFYTSVLSLMGAGGSYCVLRHRIVLRGILADMYSSTRSRLTDEEIGDS